MASQGGLVDSVVGSFLARIAFHELCDEIVCIGLGGAEGKVIPTEFLPVLRRTLHLRQEVNRVGIVGDNPSYVGDKVLDRIAFQLRRIFEEGLLAQDNHLRVCREIGCPYHTDVLTFRMMSSTRQGCCILDGNHDWLCFKGKQHKHGSEQEEQRLIRIFTKL